MTISEALLPEFDLEMATTRRLLERIPEDSLAWKPHEKSMSMGRLSGHIAELPGWLGMTLNQDSLDMQPEGAPPYSPKMYVDPKEILADFDKNVREGREVLAAATDEHFMQTWSLLRAGATILSMPKVAVVRTWIFNHIVHHRGQLSVFLRLRDAPVPSIYGPSADDSGGM